MNTPLRIGTRKSKLATWQAEHVAGLLRERGIETRLVFVKSEGDIDLTTPLSEMGGKGVFTKALDEALLQGHIDMAVHSFKDLPTSQPNPLRVAAILEREHPGDALVAPAGTEFMELAEAVVATGSNRRRAQWLHRHPGHEIADIRGNVQTRLRKLESNGWDGAIFAVAGLNRLGLEERITRYLDWMVPAPAQGAVAVMVHDDDERLQALLSPIAHQETAICTGLERELLARLEAGCSAPLGAYAWVEDGIVTLHAAVLTLDGKIQYDSEAQAKIGDAKGLGYRVAERLLEMGAKEIVEDLRKSY